MPEKQKHPLDIRSSPQRPTVRSGSLRKLGKDGSFTPSEKVKKSRLMKQFSQRNKGYSVGISQAFRDGYDGIDWGPK